MVTKSVRTIRSPGLAAGLAICTILAGTYAPGASHAQEWRLEPVLKVGVTTDDNATLSIRSDDEVDLTGYQVDAAANVYYSRSEITSFTVQPRALIRNYPDDSVFDSNDLFLRSLFRHRMQSSAFGFRLNYDEQTVRTGERTDSDLGIEDPDEIPNDDTGLVGEPGDRARLRLAPFFNYSLSNVSSVDLRLEYSDVNYDVPDTSELTDYVDARINASYQRSLSDVTDALVTLTARRFEPDGPTPDNSGYGFLAGFERAISEKTSLTAMIGAEHTDLSEDSTDTGFIGNITLTRDLETIRMFAQYQRSNVATGRGAVEARDTINVNFNRRLSERISAGLGVRAYRSQPVGDESSARERNYLQLQTKFVWYLSPAFILEADYRYTVLDRSSTIGERANSNRVGLWLVFQPNTVPKL